MRRSGLTLGAMMVGVALVMSAASAAFAAGGSLTVGSKDFSGAQLLSQLYGQALAAKGLDVTFKDNIGPTEVVFPSVKNGDIDAYGEYQGTLLTFLGGTPTGNAAETHTALKQKLVEMGTGLVASKPAPAVDVNGFFVTKKTAKKYHLSKVSDLKKVASKLVFGGPPECSQRPLCLGDLSQQLYGLNFKEVKKLDVGGPITVQALEDGDIDVALLFTGSSVIPKDAVLLRDDKGLQPADNPVLVIRLDKVTKQVQKAVDAVSAKLTTAAYNKMSLDISEKKQDPADVAAAFLKKNKLA